MLKLRFLSVLSLFLSFGSLQAMRSDSFSIVNTHIELKIKDFSSKSISGSASYKIKFVNSSNSVRFDLSKLKVDSVKLDGVTAIYNRDPELITIDLGKFFNKDDSCELSIYYSGNPAADPSGWGGFYFSGDFAFNLGVGFKVDPHSYGRAWFPCVDEFTSKSSYSFRIETDTNYMAACNGLFIRDTLINNSRFWEYKESVPMSAYLVSVSVSKFVRLESTYQGIEKVFPITLFARVQDTSKVRTSFEKLPLAIQAFEKAFGPQVYSKVGYNFVPFNNGAMEHAGNITYPIIFANGTYDYESLMAHELSHHWWGNNVTCKSEGDMWLNEGWASYCEHFFKEKVYGDSAYRESILQNHFRVLRFAHINDQGVYSLINIPKEITYGNHVYKKGADVIHSLRSVLGDSVFFKACKTYQETYKLGNSSTEDMKTVFMSAGGNQTAEAFFENWVEEKGFPHITIKKQIHSGTGPFSIKLITEQNPRFTDKIYKNLPVEIFFFKAINSYEKRIVTLNNLLDSFDLTFDFKPVFVCLDFQEKLSDAITDQYLVSSTTGDFNLPMALANVRLKKNTDSCLIRLEHHWVGPEKFRIHSPYMSDYRYYTLDGIWEDSVIMDLELIYDGRQGGVNSSNGYLDHTLIFKTEDSLTVLYRGYPGDYWRIWTDIEFSPGSKFDKQGKALIKNARKGEYVFAMYDENLELFDIPNNGKAYSFSVYPNPSTSIVKIDFLNDKNGEIEIVNSQGQVVHSYTKASKINSVELDLNALLDGVYTVRFYGINFDESKKLILRH
jgi:hypothetical protein